MSADEVPPGYTLEVLPNGRKVAVPPGCRVWLESDGQIMVEGPPAIAKLIVTDETSLLFPTVAADPSKWWMVGENLFSAARHLWPVIAAAMFDPTPGAQNADDHPFQGAYYLLVGMAFENVAKALIVQKLVKEGKPVVGGDGLAVNSGKHDLAAFFRQGGLSITSWQESVLDRLSDYVQWQGRYPVPKKVRDLGQFFCTTSGDLTDIERFIGEVRAEYERRAR